MSFAHGLRPDFRFPNGLLNILCILCIKTIYLLCSTGTYIFGPPCIMIIIYIYDTDTYYSVLTISQSLAVIR